MKGRKTHNDNNKCQKNKTKNKVKRTENDEKLKQGHLQCICLGVWVRS